MLVVMLEIKVGVKKWSILGSEVGSKAHLEKTNSMNDAKYVNTM